MKTGCVPRFDCGINFLLVFWAPGQDPCLHKVLVSASRLQHGRLTQISLNMMVFRPQTRPGEPGPGFY